MRTEKNYIPYQTGREIFVKSFIKCGIIALVVLHFGMAQQAKAIAIAYDVGTSSFSLNSDSIANGPFSGVINVPIGGSAIGTLQLGAFTVDFGNSGFAPFTLTETFIANGVLSSVTLSGTLNLTAPADFLTYTNGSPTVLTLLGGEKLIVTPLSLATIEADQPGVFEYTLQANFQLAPDAGSTLGMLFISLIVLLGAKRLRSLRSA